MSNYTKHKGLFTRCNLSCRFAGPEKSWSKSARVNGDPMRARFQSDMSADSEKICGRFTDFPASGPILQPKRTYPFAKWRTLKVNLLGKTRSFDEKEINLLMSQWSEYPCLFDKTNPDHKDQNKRADLLHNFSGPTNRHDKSQRVSRPLRLFCSLPIRLDFVCFCSQYWFPYSVQIVVSSVF